MLDDDGNRKPFEHFLNDVQKVNENYNKWYLKAEYNFALSSADMASRWQGWWEDEDRDRYLLQYRTVGLSVAAAWFYGNSGTVAGDSFIQEFYTWIGIGFMAGGAASVWKNRRYLKDEAALKKRRVEECDERNRLLDLATLTATKSNKGVS